jgi:hypothetical protein
MGKFLISEMIKQAAFKTSSPYFSAPAKEDGFYKGTAYPFCISIDYAEENLYPHIRKTAVDFFARHKIKWHDG